jgi:multiple sugar transport system permease protein
MGMGKARSPMEARKRRAAFFFLLPALLFFTAYVLYPIAQSIRLSFFEWDGIAPQVFIGLDNYRELFQDETFYKALKNNVIWLVLFLLAPPLGLALALFLNQQMRGMRFMKSMFFMPFVLSGVVIGMVFNWFYDPTAGLLALIVGHGVPVLGDEKTVTFGIIAAALWPQTAYCMILYLTGLTAVSPELIEAARIEGAKGFTLLRRVILPQLRPATFIAIVVTVIGALRSFDLISVMSDGGPYGSSTVLAFFMYENAIKYYRQGYGAAIAVVLMLIMLVYIAYFLTRMLQQEDEGR